MSEASVAAIQKAKDEAKKWGQRIGGPDNQKEIMLETAASARELRLIRGELEAIRILLSEQGTGTVASLGSDHGNP